MSAVLLEKREFCYGFSLKNRSAFFSSSTSSVRLASAFSKSFMRLFALTSSASFATSENQGVRFLDFEQDKQLRMQIQLANLFSNFWLADQRT